MRIDRLVVRNFRNLADIDLRLLPGTVIVGENRAGKSNLIHALRLILDPTFSFVDRQLSKEDFWDGLSDGADSSDPMTEGHVIEASIDIVDFEQDRKLVTALGNALVEEEPMRARLTYRFAPIDTGEDNGERPKYRGAVYGGDNLKRPCQQSYVATCISSSFMRFATSSWISEIGAARHCAHCWRRLRLRSLKKILATSVKLCVKPINS